MRLEADTSLIKRLVQATRIWTSLLAGEINIVVLSKRKSQPWVYLSSNVTFVPEPNIV
jgi:hypothetical protein